jgi:hypothetical protein
MALRLLASIAGIALVGGLLEENRRLRLERERLHTREKVLENLLFLGVARDRVADIAAIQTAAAWSEVDEASDESFPASDPPSFNAQR